MKMKLTEEEQEAVQVELEERADYLSNEDLFGSTATNDFFAQVQRKLIGGGTKLVVGPRGCGKTHMMRYAQLSCADKKRSTPFAVYVSFNRYYRLEPMLQAKANAIRLFQIWTLANILVATAASMALFAPDDEAAFAKATDFDVDDLTALIGRLETSTPFEEMNELAQRLTVATVVSALERSTKRMARRRCILLLDDAALTLTPDYLVEFFDIVRTIKTATVSPKASVYPGTTEYGPRFHAKQEAEEVPVWLSPEGSDYEHMMQAIAAKRFSELDRVSADIVDQLKYAAFGIPRAYLTMLRKFIETNAGTSQQSLNTTIDEHMTARIAEFQSLAKKVPRFESLVEVGDAFFHRVVKLLTEANREGTAGKHRQLLFGLLEESGNPLRERMLSLLLEAGMLYEHPKVSHGEDRKYRRFTPHIAALMQQRAFSGGHRGASPKRVVEFLRRPQAKHPIRRTLNKILSNDEQQNIRLSLPPCAKCNTARMTESQRFCHQCGAELLTASTFANYLEFPLVEIPGFTEWQRRKIREATDLRTIGDLLAYQDPGSELRKIPWVGKVRARNMIDLVNAHVDEFFS